MIKLFVLVLVFVVSATVLFISDTPALPTSGKITFIALEAIVFQICMMDKSFLKKDKRSELRKFIDD
ncbi:MAG: hypothetical protein QM764_10675 [Chitinophagaceae bacterium]